MCDATSYEGTFIACAPCPQLLKKGASALTFERLLEARVAWSDIFTEIPMEVVNNPLVHALTAELR